METTDRVFERFSLFVSPFKADVWSSLGVRFVMGRREGSWFWDLEGKRRILDCHGNGGTYNLGHRHPAVVSALRRALEEFDIGNHHFVSAARARLAERLAGCLPGDLQYTVFGVSGGEAVDTAIKVARGFTGRPGIVSAVGGYHGHTGFALAAGDARYREPFGPLAPGFTQVPFGDLEALERAVDRTTAAVLFETVPATLGMRVPTPDFFPRVRDLCDRAGALLIVDEVQTGLGRTGKMWAIEWYDVVPDILVTGKGLSGGLYPITATCLRAPLIEFFRRDPFIHVSTFGGSELGCLVALAMLDVVQAPGFLERVRKLADWYAGELERLRKKHASVLVEVRQLGLFLGLRYRSAEAGPRMTKLCFDEGLFALFAANDPSVQQFLPALTISDDEARFSIEVLDTCLSRLERSPD
ncbi:MAG: aspartate aminotransferase family protein [Candidatus Binatia bacterium]|nr:MAG: aspartate aminotransferase family protein [Candidatus Binatia bacterium]